MMNSLHCGCLSEVREYAIRYIKLIASNNNDKGARPGERHFVNRHYCVARGLLPNLA